MPATAPRTTRPAAAAAYLPPADRAYRFTVEQYHEMGRLGILQPSDRVYLLNGYIVPRMTIYPPHARSVGRVSRTLGRLLDLCWDVRTQQPVTLPTTASEPEPDVVLAVGPDDRYTDRHPGPRDIAIVIEVSDSSVVENQTIMLAVYAAAKLPVYWIVNLPDRRVEVYTNPRGGKNPTYRTRTDYGPADAVPVAVGGRVLGAVPVADLLP